MDQTLLDNINADEPRALDYNDFNQPGLYNPDQYRASDHEDRSQYVA
jgi:predicted extracellular nuclease